MLDERAVLIAISSINSCVFIMFSRSLFCDCVRVCVSGPGVVAVDDVTGGPVDPVDAGEQSGEAAIATPRDVAIIFTISS